MRTIKIGVVTPLTGPAAHFGEVDTFVAEAARRHFDKEGITVAGTRYQVQILLRDSQSSPEAASDGGRMSETATDLMSDAAVDLIRDGVDLVLASSGGETAISVSNACEAHGVPCITTVVPWESWFIGRGGRPGETSFTWTYHFFWGWKDPLPVYLDMWSQVNTNKIVGGLWPDDLQGNALANTETGFPPILRSAGYSVVDPGRYPDFSTDFSAFIAEYQAGHAEILTGVPEPPASAAFWREAKTSGYVPRVATLATRAVLFPSDLEALGDAAANLSSEVWWAPSHPFSSSLTGQTAAAFAADYTDSTHEQWSQPIGFSHALFEVANAALSRAASLEPESIAASISSLELDTIVGHLNWTNGPVKNVATTPLVGGQWQRGTDHPFELMIVSNQDHPELPRNGSMQPIE
jgi:branched-chain amino acid transport system substrate-binding protein